MANTQLFLYLLLLAVVVREVTGSNATLTFSVEPRDVVVARGQSALLDCVVDDGFLPASTSSSTSGAAPGVVGEEFQIVWFQNRVRIDLPDARRRLLTNGSLYFEKVLHKRSGRSHSDEGVYQCLAHNSIGAFISANATVTVASLARDFSESPSDASVQVDDVVRLACKIDSVPEASVVWEKDGQRITDVITDDQFQPGSRLVTPTPGVLHIYHVQKEDAGNYRCVARNAVTSKERRSSVGKLSVVDRTTDSWRPTEVVAPPPLTPSTSFLWALEGSDVTLECAANGQPQPVSWWTFNGADLVTGGAVVVRPGYLRLNGVVTSMEGDYFCQFGTNTSAITGSDTSTFPSSSSGWPLTSLRVATAPQFIEVPQSQVFPTAKTVRFECHAAGNPTPTIKWLKDGVLVPIGGRIKRRMRGGGSVSELVLSNTVTSDSGIYQCLAENLAGSRSASARLLVNVSEGRPLPPDHLKASVVNWPDEVVLSWASPQNVASGDVKAYSIHYASNDGNEELQKVSANTTIALHSLKASTTYSFYVRAYTQSASDPSRRFFFTTPADTESAGVAAPAASTAPNVTLVPLSPTSLKVSWPPVASEASRRPVSLYKIQYRRHQSNEFDIEVVRGDSQEYTLNGLHPGKKYDVRILLGSLDVAGQWFTQQMPRVPSGDASDAHPPVADLQLLCTNATSILATWTPLPSASIIGYKLTYRMQGEEHQFRLVFDVLDRSYLATNLQPDAVYSFHLFGVKDQDVDFQPSSKSIRTLDDETRPEVDAMALAAPTQLEAEPLAWNRLRLSWMPPAEVLPEATYYTVRYIGELSPSASFPASVIERKWTRIRCTDVSLEVPELTAHTVYHLSVRYHDASDGTSSVFSPSVNIRTLADVPSAPRDISWMLDGGAVWLKWSPPLRPNGVVVGYIIRISADEGLAEGLWTIQEEAGERLSAHLRGLRANHVYYIRIQAKTSAGLGESSAPVMLTTQVRASAAGGGNPDANPHVDQHLGVVIGLAIGVAFTLITALFLLWRSRCIKSLHQEGVDGVSALQRHRNGSGGGVGGVGGVGGGVGVVQNGNGFLKPGNLGLKVRNASGNAAGMLPVLSNGDLGGVGGGGGMVEMDVFVPMLSTIPVDDAPHLDTKGGYLTASGSSYRGSLNSDSIHRCRPLVSSSDQDRDQDQDRSAMPLLPDAASSLDRLTTTINNSTILSQTTQESLCLHSLHSQSLHSLHSSIRTIDASSSSSASTTSSSSSSSSGSSSSDECCTNPVVADVPDVGKDQDNNNIHFVVSATSSVPTNREFAELII